MDSRGKNNLREISEEILHTQILHPLQQVFLVLREASNRTGLHFTGNKYVNGVPSVG